MSPVLKYDNDHDDDDGDDEVRTRSTVEKSSVTDRLQKPSKSHRCHRFNPATTVLNPPKMVRKHLSREREFVGKMHKDRSSLHRTMSAHRISGTEAPTAVMVGRIKGNCTKRLVLGAACEEWKQIQTLGNLATAETLSGAEARVAVTKDLVCTEV